MGQAAQPREILERTGRGWEYLLHLLQMSWCCGAQASVSVSVRLLQRNTMEIYICISYQDKRKDQGKL